MNIYWKALNICIVLAGILYTIKNIGFWLSVEGNIEKKVSGYPILYIVCLLFSLLAMGYGALWIYRWAQKARKMKKD